MKPFDRRELWGFWFEPATGKVFAEQDATTPASDFTFENAWYVSTGNWGQPSRPLSFFHAPTEETANRVFVWAKKIVGSKVVLELVKEPIKNDPYGFETSPAWSILATRKDEGEGEASFSAGLLASSIIRHGDGSAGWAAQSFLAELKSNGVL